MYLNNRELDLNNEDFVNIKKELLELMNCGTDVEDIDYCDLSVPLLIAFSIVLENNKIAMGSISKIIFDIENMKIGGGLLYHFNCFNSQGNN